MKKKRNRMKSSEEDLGGSKAIEGLQKIQVM